MTQISPYLTNLYEDYFETDSAGTQERALAAVESVAAIQKMGGHTLGSVIDVGAGDGVVSAEIDRHGLATTITAAEISPSGLSRIRARKFRVPVKIQQIDGYTLPFEDSAFATAVCSHVIEHVEHERIFLREIARVADQMFLIAPLEGCLRGRVDRRMGHINYYSPMSLSNLVETSGFRIEESLVFPASSEREQIISGRFAGALKSAIRRSVTLLARGLAPHLMTHVMAIQAIPERLSQPTRLSVSTPQLFDRL